MFNWTLLVIAERNLKCGGRVAVGGWKLFSCRVGVKLGNDHS